MNSLPLSADIAVGTQELVVVEPAPEPEPAAANGSSTDEDARPKREKAGNEGYRETTMDDLKAAPMPLAQNVVLALAALGVVAIVAWYLFLR